MKYGLIGERLGHSFSKSIHEALADYTYETCELEREALTEFFKKREFEAINVTIPYKEVVMELIDEIDPAALAIGAVNTVVKRDGKLYGYNTDIYGMTKLFGHAGIEVGGKKVAILGTGGTSKTAYACANALGASEVIRVSRTSREDAISYEQLYAEHADAEIIVNTTPSGMYPTVEGCPVDLGKLPRVSGVIDAVYNPMRTELVMNALENGIAAEGGLYMLVAQAVKASELFIGRSYDEGATERVYQKICREKENVVLIGMPSSGKSSVGAVLKNALGRDFKDTDAEIVRREGEDIPSIFRERGESAFRDAESAAVAECARGSSLIIATGGGAILRKENVRALKRTGRLYFIDRPLELLIPTGDRPLSSTRAAVEERYRERYPIYKAVCDVHIDGSGSVGEVAERIIKEFCK